MRRIHLTLTAFLCLFMAPLFAQTELCDNGIDDDGDGLIDCQDDDLANDCCCLDAWTIDFGEDLLICAGDVVVLDAGPGFVSYEWQDRSTNQTIEATDPGEYSVMAVDTCGNTVEDFIFISHIPIIQASEEFSICPGDTLELDDLKYHQEGQFTQSFTSILTGCDSILEFSIEYYQVQNEFQEHVFCEGEGVNINGIDYFQEGIFSQVITDANGCEAQLIINTFHDPFCNTCGDQQGFNRLEVVINKISVDLADLQIYSYDHLVYRHRLDPASVQNIIDDFVQFKSVSNISLKDVKDHYKNMAFLVQKNKLTKDLKSESMFIKSLFDDLRVGYTMRYN